jgi:hypothetical protein
MHDRRAAGASVREVMAVLTIVLPKITANRLIFHKCVGVSAPDHEARDR